jgi:hypothetical protein
MDDNLICDQQNRKIVMRFPSSFAEMIVLLLPLAVILLIYVYRSARAYSKQREVKGEIKE